MRTLSLSWLICLLGCAQSVGTRDTEPSREIPAASAGDEASPEPQSPEPQNDPAPARPSRARSGPANVTVSAVVDGKPVAAQVRVLDDASGTTSPSGAALTLAAGTHKIEVQISDEAALADKPKQVREVFLDPGQDAHVEASFPWSKVQLNVLVSGRTQNGVRVNLLRNDAVVAQLQSGAAPALITPGKYEADVLLKGTTIRVKGILFMESATQVVPVRVQH